SAADAGDWSVIESMREDKTPSITTVSEPDPTRSSWRERITATRRRRGWLVIGAAGVLLILLAVWLWPSKKPSASEEEANIVVSVRVAKAERESISSEVTALGTIFPLQEA